MKKIVSILLVIIAVAIPVFADGVRDGPEIVLDELSSIITGENAAPENGANTIEGWDFGRSINAAESVTAPALFGLWANRTDTRTELYETMSAVRVTTEEVIPLRGVRSSDGSFYLNTI